MIYLYFLEGGFDPEIEQLLNSNEGNEFIRNKMNEFTDTVKSGKIQNNEMKTSTSEFRTSNDNSEEHRTEKKSKKKMKRQNLKELMSTESEMGSKLPQPGGSLTESQSGNGNTDTVEKSIISDAWSEDGLIHCVETSDDVITCHTRDEPHSHQDVQVDESHNQHIVLVDEPHNHHNIKVDEGLDWYTKRQNAKKIDSSKSLSESNSVANDDIDSQRNSSFVKLDVTGGKVSVVDSKTGERKPLAELGREEEVDVNSLTSQPTTKTRSLNQSAETLHELLENMNFNSYERLHVDYDDSTTFEIWENDHNCSRYVLN